MSPAPFQESVNGPRDNGCGRMSGAPTGTGPAPLLAALVPGALPPLVIVRTAFAQSSGSARTTQLSAHSFGHNNSSLAASGSMTSSTPDSTGRPAYGQALSSSVVWSLYSYR